MCQKQIYDKSTICSQEESDIILYWKQPLIWIQVFYLFLLLFIMFIVPSTGYSLSSSIIQVTFSIICLMHTSHLAYFSS